MRQDSFKMFTNKESLFVEEEPPIIPDTPTKKLKKFKQRGNRRSVTNVVNEQTITNPLFSPGKLKKDFNSTNILFKIEVESPIDILNSKENANPDLTNQPIIEEEPEPIQNKITPEKEIKTSEHSNSDRLSIYTYKSKSTRKNSQNFKIVI